MSRNYLEESSSSSELSLQVFAPFDDRTKSIKTYLIHQLRLTPRRKLFDEFEEKLNKLTEIKLQDEIYKQFSSPEVSMSIKNEFKNLAALNEFRINNARECMSNFSYRRIERTKESEENFLKHSCIHRYHLNDRLFPAPVNTDDLGNSLCELCQKPADASAQKLQKPIIIDKSTSIRDVINSQEATKQPIFLLEINEPQENKKCKQRNKNFDGKFRPDNSLALTHQKLKY